MSNPYGRLARWHEDEIRGWLEVPGSYALGKEDVQALVDEIDALRGTGERAFVHLGQGYVRPNDWQSPVGARIIADSIHAHTDARITTFECIAPVWMLAEINTHAMIRRNAASARAVPTIAYTARIVADPFLPIEWKYRAPEGGMQAGALMSPEDARASDEDWIGAMRAILPYLDRLEKRKGAKEHINRLLSAFAYTVIVMTATEWDNYFTLRGPSGGAAPEFKRLVSAQMEAYAASTPVVRGLIRQRERDSWHLPYISEEERAMAGSRADLAALVALSASRVAGVSYYRPGDYGDVRKQLDRAMRLADDGHWSPWDQPARVASDEWNATYRYWKPARKFFGGESGSTTHGTQTDEWLPMELRSMTHAGG